MYILCSQTTEIYFFHAEAPKGLKHKRLLNYYQQPEFFKLIIKLYIDQVSAEKSDNSIQLFKLYNALAHQDHSKLIATAVKSSVSCAIISKQQWCGHLHNSLKHKYSLTSMQLNDLARRFDVHSAGAHNANSITLRQFQHQIN